jgi:hypothetical protein
MPASAPAAVVGEDGRVFGADVALLSLLTLGALVLKVWALADAVYRPAPAYLAAGKLTKLAWVAILAVAVLLTGGDVLGLLGLVSVVAAIVYLVDVRPAVRGMRAGGPWA